MPTYADRAAFEDYVEGWVTDDADALDRLLGRAERDIDRLLVGNPALTTTGLRIDPATLSAWERDALSRAVCAQAEHRVTVGEAALREAIRAQRVKGPDFDVVYSNSPEGAGPRMYGPKVALELAPIAHLRPLTARPVP